jgi:hypothetical protein
MKPRSRKEIKIRKEFGRKIEIKDRDRDQDQNRESRLRI